MSEDTTPTVEGVIDTAENRIILRDGVVADLEDLLTPGFSRCRSCPLKPRGDLPARCTSYQLPSSDIPDPHCVIEEAMVIETVITFRNNGIDPMDKFALFSVLNNMLNLHRLSRAGQVIDFSQVGISKVSTDLINKYVSMTSSMNNQYIKSLKEMLATRKEDSRNKVEVANSTSKFMTTLNEAKKIEDIREHNKKAEKEHLNDRDRGN